MTATKLTAREKLQLSRLHLTQQELLGEDIDVEHLNFQIKNVFGVDIAPAITDSSAERTIEGASTLMVQILDRDRKILRSGMLRKNADVRIDGLWFRLVAINKQGDDLTLTFEDREIAVLRTYNSVIKASSATSRNKITRAQFVLRLIREVKEFKIPWVIPELERIQPIEEDKNQQSVGGQDHTLVNRGKGIPHGAGQTISSATEHHHPESHAQRGLTIKGDPMSNAQIDVANAILNTGASMRCTRPELVMSIMCVITESSCQNLRGGDRDSVGAFQQRASQGWPASRNVSRDARAFFTALKTEVSRHPNWNYGQLVQGVQNSAYPDRYAQWRGEAERVVDAYGESADFDSQNNMYSSEAGQGDYEFYRGIPPAQGLHKWGKENSWDCIQRLAEEVGWRAFFVSGTFYFLTEHDLMQSKPAAILRETSRGVDSIDGDYDTGKKNAEVTISCHMSRWSSPPGSVIWLKDMGPFGGRWLVNDIKRSLFESVGQITLKKPRPALPEPIGDTVGTTYGQQDAQFGSGGPITPVGKEFIKSSDAAKKILQYHNKGKYRDDNGKQIAQLKKIANGQKLHNQCGNDVQMDVIVLNGILALLDNDYWVGTFALCEDHSCNDGQHPKGQAADISSLGKAGTGWKSLNTYNLFATQLAKEAMKILQPFSWDLICNGVGRYDSTVQALQMDNGHHRDGNWESDHINHIHFGSAPGRRDA